MRDIRKYVHIGGPKCASTALQLSFFAKHRDLYHLGSGYAGRNHKYIDDGVSILAEADLRYKKHYLFDANRSRAAIAEHLGIALGDSRIKAIGLSSEFFSFTLGNEIDVADKARRLLEVFGENTCIVLVFREQISLLTSLYTEMIKCGYPGTSRQFFEYTYTFQDRNWCIDFCFDRLVDTYSSLFGSANVCALPFELLKKNEASFLATISSRIGISEMNTRLRQVNARTSVIPFLEQVRRFNEKYQHQYGSAFFTPFDTFRISPYLKRELNVTPSDEQAIDDFMQVPFIEAAARIMQMKSREGVQMPSLDLTVPPDLLKRLQAIYGPSNRRLAKLTGFDLESLGYHLG